MTPIELIMHFPQTVMPSLGPFCPAIVEAECSAVSSQPIPRMSVVNLAMFEDQLFASLAVHG